MHLKIYISPIPIYFYTASGFVYCVSFVILRLTMSLFRVPHFLYRSGSFWIFEKKSFHMGETAREVLFIHSYYSQYNILHIYMIISKNKRKLDISVCNKWHGLLRIYILLLFFRFVSTQRVVCLCEMPTSYSRGRRQI